MKNFVSSAAMLLSLCAGAASAGDLPGRKTAPVFPPPPPPAPLWTGFYAGLNGGGIFGGSSTQLTQFDAVTVGGTTTGGVGAGSVSNNAGGFIGGGQIGYNYQFGPSFVAGLEADIQGIGASNDTTTVVGALPLGAGQSVLQSTTVSRSLDYLGTVRGRLGYLVTPTLLVYGTGGLAYGGANLGASSVQIITPAGLVGGGSSVFSDTQVGWTAGGGVEWLFHPNWSVKVEYLYYDLGVVTGSAGALNNYTVGRGSFALGVPTPSARFDGHIVRAGVNYHFNWGAPIPVIAKF